MASDSWRCDVCGCVYEAHHTEAGHTGLPLCPNCQEAFQVVAAGEGGWPATERVPSWLWAGIKLPQRWR